MAIETDDIGRINENLYIEVFKSRKDCYAIQRYDGSYAPADREFDAEIVEHHVTGEYTTGQYVVDPVDNSVKFACIDNDVDEEGVSLDAALDASLDERTAAQKLGIDKSDCWIEFSGRRGYHFWIFFETKVPAIHAKKLMEAIVREAQPEEGDLIEGGHTEVFPKQIALTDIDYGNLVKTPLGFHQKTGNRMLFVDDYGDPFPDQGGILRAVSRNRVSFEKLRDTVEDLGEDLDKLEEAVEEREKLRSRDVQIDEEISVRPCIKEAMNGQKGDLRGDQGHCMRLALAAEMVNSGMEMDEMIEVFSQFGNYDEEITRKKLREIKREGHRPWKCDTLREKCPEFVEDCPCPYRNPDALTAMEFNRQQYAEDRK